MLHLKWECSVFRQILWLFLLLFSEDRSSVVCSFCWQFSVRNPLTSYKSLWIFATIIYLACYVIAFPKQFCYFSIAWCLILCVDDTPGWSTLIVLHKITVFVFSLVPSTKLVSYDIPSITYVTLFSFREIKKYSYIYSATK